MPRSPTTSVTTSVRLTADLRRRLDQYARRHRMGRNRVITEALRRHLNADEADELAAEARRQSLLADEKAAAAAAGSPSEASDNVAWEDATSAELWPED